MSVATETSEPLLSQKDAFSLEQIAATDGTASGLSCETEEGQVISLFDDYGSVGGVPARVLMPSDGESRFTCHAYSQDGSRMAIGESNGCIRLWSTVKYSFVFELKDMFDKSVEAISFVESCNDQFIAIDGAWKVLEVKVVRKCQDEGESVSKVYEVHICREMHVEMPEGIHRPTDKSTAQFSENGRVLACVYWNPTGAANTSGHKWTRTYEFQQQAVSSPVHVDHPKADAAPVLSESGRSLLIQTGKRVMHRRVVIPESMADREIQMFEVAEGKLVHWSKDADVILMNFADEERESYLEVHKINCHDSFETTAQLSRDRECDPSLSYWDAQLLNHPKLEEEIEVLLLEVSKKGDMRFLIWNVTKNIVTEETSLPLLSRGQPSQPCLEEGTVRFCISKERDWIWTFSSSHRICALLSVRSGTVAWSYEIPDTLVGSFPDTCQAVVDPTEHHFMFFGETAIIGFAPGVLNPQSTTREHRIDLHSVASCEDYDNDVVRHALHNLPSEALAQGMHSITDLPFDRELDFENNPITYLYREHDPTEYPDLADAVAFDEDHHLVFISEDAEGFVRVVIHQEESDDRRSVTSEEEDRSSYPMTFADLVFPLGIQSSEEVFTPGKVFMYMKQDDKADGLVLLSRTSRLPVVVFGDLADHSWRMVHFEMEICLRFSQTADRRKLCLLDVDSVCIVDLRSEKIIGRVKYDLKFSQIYPLIEESTKWSHWRKEKNFEVCERRMSDDGCTVLLAWDVQNRKSVLVTPSTQQSECVECIREANGNLSEFCELSWNGKCCSFIDVDDLPTGSITIGSATKTGIIRPFHVVDCPAAIGMKMDDLSRLLSSVHYTVLNDGSEIVIVVFGKGWHRGTGRKEQFVRTFNIYGASNMLPDYEQLVISNPSSAESMVERCVDSYGLSALNGPPMNKKSIFQKAMVKQNKEMTKSIEAKAKSGKMNLAIEWTKEFDSPSNLLSRALKENLSNGIKDAIQLIGTNLVPFRSAARVVKDAFLDLSLNQRDALMTALSKNRFVYDTNQLNVHVDFLDPALRQLSAVHIDTSETFLEWTSFTQSNYLDEKWKEKNDAAVMEMERNGNVSTVPAVLKFVCIEDGALVGLKGILRLLLFKRMPAHVFEFDAVKWIIQYKWFKIWKGKFIKSFVLYGSFLVFFTLYAVMVGAARNLADDNLWSKIASSVLLMITFVFGLFMLREEIRQLRRYTKDGEELYRKNSTRFPTMESLDFDKEEDFFFSVLSAALQIEPLLWLFPRVFEGPNWFNKDPVLTLDRAKLMSKEMNQCLAIMTLGVRHFVQSRWNWVDLLSCLMLLVFIPVFHCLEVFDLGFRSYLSAFVAIETILAYIKIWYFAQPFRNTGAQVLMIDNIIKDCLSFLFLAFVVLCGFALGLHVLFRDVFPCQSDGNMAANMGAEGPPVLTAGCEPDPDGFAEQAEEEYGTVWSSMTTLFYALLGAFEPQMYRLGGKLSWLITLVFIVYLVSLVVVLLNLLISIMGDTFDKVKSSEQAQLLMGRAKFIDSCEAALSDEEIDEINRAIGKYVYAVVDPDGAHDQQASDQWLGKLNAIDSRLRESVAKSEESVKQIISQSEEAVVETVRRVMKDNLGTAIQELEARIMENVSRAIQEFESRMSENTTQLKGSVDQMQQSSVDQFNRIASLLEQRRRA